MKNCFYINFCLTIGLAGTEEQKYKSHQQAAMFAT